VGKIPEGDYRASKPLKRVWNRDLSITPLEPGVNEMYANTRFSHQRNSWIICNMTTTSAIGIAGAATCAVLLLLIQARGTIVMQKRERSRREWRQKIEQIADDYSTDPEGLSFDDIMDLLDPPYWQDLYAELEKLPPGQRSLRKAVEKVEQEES
jgi:hypothetical protein